MTRPGRMPPDAGTRYMHDSSRPRKAVQGRENEMGRITRLFLVLAAAIALVAAPAIGQVRGQSEQEKEEFMRKAREEQIAKSMEKGEPA